MRSSTATTSRRWRPPTISAWRRRWRAELFDTSLQHGPATIPTACTLIERTNAIGTLAEVGERAWLDGFFDVRIDDLTNPADADAEDWRQSTDRVECMRRIAASGNYDLAGPLTFSVYGDEFTIE